MKKIILLSAYICLASIAHGQFFSVKKNDALIKAGINYITADGFFDNDGEVQKLLDYRTATIFIYGEYGISNRISGLIRGPLYMSSSADFIFTGAEKKTQSASAMGDLIIGLSYNIFVDKPFELKALLFSELPSGKADNRYNLNTGYGIVSPGIELKGRYDVTPSLYINAYGGFTRRTNDFTDEIFSGGEAGYQVYNGLWAILHLDGVDPLENGDDKLTGGLPGLYHNNSGYLKAGIEIDYRIKSAGIFAAFHYPLKGQFVHAAPDYRAGVFIIIANEK